MERIRGKPAHKLLMALSLFATDASREALGYVAGLGEDILSRDEGLVTLERLALVNKQSDRFSMLPLTKIFVESEFFKNPSYREEAEKALIQWYIDFTTQNVQREGATFQIGSFPLFLGGEIQNLLLVLKLCYERRAWRSALSLWDRISNVVWLNGFWNVLELYDLMAMKAAQQLGDVEFYARFCGNLSWFYIAVDQYDIAIQYTQKMLDTYEELNRQEEKAYALRNMGEAYTRKGEIETARSYLSNSLNLAEQVGSETVEVRVLGSLAKLEMKTKNYATAYKLYEKCWYINKERLEKAPQVGERTGSLVGIIVGLRGMGDAARQLGRYQEARKRLEKSLEWAQSEDIIEEVARSQLSLAKLNALEENSQSTKSLAEAALGTFSRLGLSRETDEAEQLLSSISELPNEEG
jgi:LuxR family glucitol operon transcriptional activator